MKIKQREQKGNQAKRTDKQKDKLEIKPNERDRKERHNENQAKGKTRKISNQMKQINRKERHSENQRKETYKQKEKTKYIFCIRKT